MHTIINLFFSLTILFLIAIPSVLAARDTNSFDGNIFPIYAGNGSLVPPQTTIKDSIKKNRTSVVIYYLDDSSTSKQFSPVVSGLKLVWKSSIDIIPLTTDELKVENKDDKNDPAFYWHGKIPQIVVINGNGEIVLDKEGQVNIETINNAISKATGLKAPDFNIEIKSYNEYNSEAAKEGYTDAR